MDIMKSIGRLGLLSLVLTSTATAAAEGDLHWAVATDVFQLKDSLLSGPQSYGAAWNFPSLEEAEIAAFKACGRESPRGECNTRASAGKNSCFFIIRWDTTYDNYSGKHTTFGVSQSEGYPSRTAAESAAKQSAADNYTNWEGTHHKGSVELVQCAGVK